MPTPRLPTLREANTEPGGETIFGVVSLLHAIVGPLTQRDWRRQELLPRTGGLVIVANHISNVDPLALGQFVAFSGRWPRFLGKMSVFKVPIVGRIIRACGQIPVERDTGRSRDALVTARAAIEAGRAVVVYPEGTITYDPDLWPMRGKTGAARLALETSCPVIPVGQWGAQEIMYGRQRHLPKLLPRKTLRLAVGEPVELDDLRTAPITAASLTEATERIMAAITALVAELRGEPAPAQRLDPRAQRHDGAPGVGPG